MPTFNPSLLPICSDHVSQHSEAGSATASVRTVARA
jgi:hypothetical protein